MHVSVDKVLNDFPYQHAFVRLSWVLCTITEPPPKGLKESYLSYQKNKYSENKKIKPLLTKKNELAR